uniref:Uncharacterized protein n=1 Tax=Oryza punctata TaxID=4537 RepID=A0A0E0L8H7_ORYPU
MSSIGHLPDPSASAPYLSHRIRASLSRTSLPHRIRASLPHRIPSPHPGIAAIASLPHSSLPQSALPPPPPSRRCPNPPSYRPLLAIPNPPPHPTPSSAQLPISVAGNLMTHVFDDRAVRAAAPEVAGINDRRYDLLIRVLDQTFAGFLLLLKNRAAKPGYEGFKLTIMSGNSY